MTATSTISAEELDHRFDNGEDLEEFFEMDSPIVRRGEGSRRVNITMPLWLIDELDAEARRLSSSRQSVINTRLADYFDAKRHNRTTA